MGKGVSKDIASTLADKGNIYIKAIAVFRIHQEGSGHDKDDVFALLVIEVNVSILCQYRYKRSCIEGVAVAPEGAVVAAQDDGFLDLIGIQVIHHIGIGIYAVIPDAAMELIRHGFRELGRCLYLCKVGAFQLGGDFRACGYRKGLSLCGHYLRTAATGT